MLPARSEAMWFHQLCAIIQNWKAVAGIAAVAWLRLHRDRRKIHGLCLNWYPHVARLFRMEWWYRILRHLKLWTTGGQLPSFCCLTIHWTVRYVIRLVNVTFRIYPTFKDLKKHE